MKILVLILITLGGWLLSGVTVPWLTVRGKIRAGIAKLQEPQRKAKKERAKDYVRRINGKAENLAKRSQKEAMEVFERIGQREGYQKTMRLSLITAAGGAAFGAFLRNPMLSIVLAVGFYFIPLWATRFQLYRYDRYLNEELETALSLITTSYTRSNDILAAVSENLGNINEPVKGVFTSFVNNLRYVDANAPAQIERMKATLDNPIWWQWCDSLILCQADHTLRDALIPIVGKFSDLRIQQEENATKMMLPLQRAGIMVALAVCVPVILYFFNENWANNLLYTTFGQISLTVTAIVLLVSINAAIKLSRPIQYNV